MRFCARRVGAIWTCRSQLARDVSPMSMTRRTRAPLSENMRQRAGGRPSGGAPEAVGVAHSPAAASVGITVASSIVGLCETPSSGPKRAPLGIKPALQIPTDCKKRDDDERGRQSAPYVVGCTRALRRKIERQRAERAIAGVLKLARLVRNVKHAQIGERLVGQLGERVTRRLWSANGWRGGGGRRSGRAAECAGAVEAASRGGGRV